MSEKYEGGWFDTPRVIDPHELGTVMVDCFNSIPDHLIARLADVFEQVADWYAHTINQYQAGTIEYFIAQEIAREELGEATWFLGFSVSPDSSVYKATQIEEGE